MTAVRPTDRQLRGHDQIPGQNPISGGVAWTIVAVNVGPSLTYHDQNYPDYRSGLRTKSRLRIWNYGSRITDPDYESGLQIRIAEPDYGTGLWNTDRNNFGHDRLNMDQDLPHFYIDNFSRDNPTNDALTWEFGQSVIWIRRVIAGLKMGGEWLTLPPSL